MASPPDTVLPAAAGCDGAAPKGGRPSDDLLGQVLRPSSQYGVFTDGAVFDALTGLMVAVSEVPIRAVGRLLLAPAQHPRTADRVATEAAALPWDPHAVTGEHDGDPAGITAGPTRPQRTQHGGVRTRRPGCIGEIGQRTRSGMPDHPRSVSGDTNPGTRTDSPHAESAFHPGRQNPSTRFSVPVQKALSRSGPPLDSARAETARSKTQQFRSRRWCMRPFSLSSMTVSIPIRSRNAKS